jgi:hypothetical protein
VNAATGQTDAAGGAWLTGRMPDPGIDLPPTHDEFGACADFTYRRRPAGWDPEAELADFAEDD